MADSRLKQALDLLSAGAKAGESLGEVRNNPIKKLANALDDILNSLSETLSWGVQGNSEAQIRYFVAPFDLEIIGVKAAFSGTVTNTPTLAINNRKSASSANANVLSAATFDLSGLSTANEAEAVTLSATAANLLVKAGDVVSATVTTDGTEDHDGIAVQILYKPIVSAS